MARNTAASRRSRQQHRAGDHTPRGWATIVAMLGVAVLGIAGLVPAASAEESLSVGAPRLDLHFEGDVADSSSFAHPTQLHGRDQAAPKVSYTDGMTAGTKAISFGGDTYLDLGSSRDLLPTSLSLSYWFKPEAKMSGEEIITWNKAAYNSDGFYVSSVSDSNPLLLSVGAASGLPREYRVSTTDRAAFFPAGEWTHIVITFDAASKAATFYRNGIRVPSTAQNMGAAGVIDPDADVTKTIGYNGPNYNGGYLKSSLDEYRLFSGVATVSDVATLFEEGGGSIDRASLAEEDAEAISLPETATIALALPAVGSRGSDITWTSSDTNVIAVDGTVTPPAEGKTTVTLTAQVSYAGGPAAVREIDVTVAAPAAPLRDSGLDVLLSDDYLQNAAAKEHQYLLSLSSDKFLYWFYRTAGLTPPTSEGYGGWENGNVTWNFRGHAFGHYMSALSMSYASTQDAEVKAGLLAQITDAVNGLEEVQASYEGTAREGYLGPFRDTALDAVEGRGESDDPVIVPYYDLHKVLAGLLDIDKYVPGALGERALTIAEGFGEYLYGRVSTLSDRSKLLSTEYGGMNEALYELFARSGGNEHIKAAAEGFDEVSLFQKLADGEDVLSGKHANTTIPKFIGALKRYTVFSEDPQLYEMLTEKEKAELPMYRAAAENFWRIVVDDHSYATGANSQSEHFHAPGQLYADATQRGADTGNPQTAETCNEYNMLKLTRELFKINQDVSYANFYENTFINTILSSQNPDTGMTTYFQAMAPGYFKVYGQPFTEFWCCIGTGMENFSKLGDSMYFTDRSGVWVNMFFSSQFDHAATNLRVRQTAAIPNDDTVTFEVSAIDGGQVADEASLRLRVPGWIAGDPVVTVNSEAIEPVIDGGYIVLTDLHDGDVIRYTMPMEVRIEATADNADFVAFRYGPVLLSTGLGTKNITKEGSVGVGVRIASFDETAQQRITVTTDTTAQWRDAVASNVQRIEDSRDGQVQFVLKNTVDGGDLIFTPHYERHAERYGLYMTLEVPDSPAAQADILKRKQQERENAIVIDSLTTFDNNNAEASKNVQYSNSSVGSFSSRTYRHANSGGWFSYDLEVDPDAAANYLRATYYSGDKGRSFDVYLNDVKLKTQTITDEAGSGVFYPVTDQIPQEYVTGAKVRHKVDANGAPVLDEAGNPIPVVTIKFQSTGGYAGGVFGLQTLRPAEYDTTAALRALQFDGGKLAPTFDPATTQYVLTVPEGTESVDVDADPWVSSGLVKVGDILIDDTIPRHVSLTPGDEKVLTITGFAQDHTTSQAYTVRIREAAAASLSTQLAATTRCVAGKVVLVTTLTGDDQVAVDALIATPFGKKAVAGLAPGAHVSHAIPTRSGAVEAGTVTAELTAEVDGEAVNETLAGDYAAAVCAPSGSAQL